MHMADTKRYAGWKGPTPGFAIARMIEFHEGKKNAKGAWERVVEIDQIVQIAIDEALESQKGGFTPRTEISKISKISKARFE
jgi:hypothetical protein